MAVFSVSEIVISIILLVTILAIIGVIIWIRIDAVKKQNALKDDISKLSNTLSTTDKKIATLSQDFNNDSQMLKTRTDDMKSMINSNVSSLKRADERIHSSLDYVNNSLDHVNNSLEDVNNTLEKTSSDVDSTNKVNELIQDNLKHNWIVQEENDTMLQKTDVSLNETVTKQFHDLQNSFRTKKLKLGDKWQLSAIGDGHGNDEWLRLMNSEGTDYYGGLAAGEMWTKNLSTNTINLGDKWKLSAIGDGHANDEWLRFMNTDGSNYYGGIAAGGMWTRNLIIDNGNGTHSYFPWTGNKQNYVRGDTNVDGELKVNTGKGITIDNGNGTFSHFPASDKQNYLRGDTNVDGSLKINQGKGLIIDNGDGTNTQFSASDKQNYIRGTTNVDGILNVNDSLKVKSELCINNVCITSDNLNKLKSL